MDGTRKANDCVCYVCILADYDIFEARKTGSFHHRTEPDRLVDQAIFVSCEKTPGNITIPVPHRAGR